MFGPKNLRYIFVDRSGSPLESDSIDHHFLVGPSLFFWIIIKDNLYQLDDLQHNQETTETDMTDALVLI